MSSISLKQICKRYGSKSIIEDLSLEVADGSFTVLLGPSGCGKSTTLRMIAGLEKPTSGAICIDGENMAGVEPGQRGVAMVFQNYALYPTMTVRQNIEYGLKNNKVPPDERKRLIEEVIDIVDLANHMDKKPQFLSGGERQRVALARAMVKKPKVFLMDEPLSNLDAKLRSQLRNQLIELHQNLGTTFLYVTHDQVEAMSMGTDIVLMNEGQIMQQDSPQTIYYQPNNCFTSKFIGSPPMNMFKKDELPGLFPIMPDNCEVCGIRPEKLQVFVRDTCPEDEREDEYQILSAKLISYELLGAEAVYSLELKSGAKIKVKQYADQGLDMDQAAKLRNSASEKNRELSIRLNTKDMFYFDSNEKRIPFKTLATSPEMAV